MLRGRSASNCPDTTQPDSKVARADDPEVQATGCSPPDESNQVLTNVEQPPRSDTASPPGPAHCKLQGFCSLRTCHQQCGNGTRSIYMAFDMPFCSKDCREQAVLNYMNECGTSEFNYPPVGKNVDAF